MFYGNGGLMTLEHNNYARSCFFVCLFVFSSDGPKCVSAQKGGVFIAWYGRICCIVWDAWGCKANCTSVGRLSRTEGTKSVLSMLSAVLNYLQNYIWGFFSLGLTGHSKKDVWSKLIWYSVIWQHGNITTKIIPAIFSFWFDLFSLCFHVLHW